MGIVAMIFVALTVLLAFDSGNIFGSVMLSAGITGIIFGILAMAGMGKR